MNIARITSIASALVPLIVLSVALTQNVAAQVSPAKTSPSSPREDETLVLSPFEVTGSKDDGYVAASTLAGSRLNTSLADTPAAVSVFTKDFLDDIGALSNVDALQYGLNANRDLTEYTGGVGVQQSDAVIQLRGLSAAIYRDYFTWRVSSDAYATERIDFARGPNSILFGVGAVGGVMNIGTKTALIGKNANTVQVRIGDADDYRGAIDVNASIGKKFAVRVSAAKQDRKSWREFDNYHLEGAALAMTYRPFAYTSIRVQAEHNDKRQVTAMPWLNYDFLSPWINGGSQIAATNTTPVIGTQNNTSRALVWDPISGSGLQSWFNTRITSAAPSAVVIGTGRSFTNFSIVPKYASLSGPTNATDNRNSVYTIFVGQKLGQLDIELAYNRQGATRNIRAFSGGSKVQADVNPLLPNGQANPNVGKLYFEANPSSLDIYDWAETWRATLGYKWDLSDRKMGVHQLSALAMRETFDNANATALLVNITPAGTSIYPLDQTNANNRINMRTYLDYSSSDPSKRGAFSPSKYPVENINGVTAAFRPVTPTQAIGGSTAVTDSYMIADQSQFWSNRLIVTMGMRHDKQVVHLPSSNGGRDPVTGVYLERERDVSQNEFSGNTHSLGAVFRPLPWLGLFYNFSKNFSLQGQTSILGDALGAKTGQGHDFGAKFNLMSGRINLTITHYQVNQLNQFFNTAIVTTTLLPLVNNIYEALGQTAKSLTTTGRDTADVVSDGWEMDLTANVTKHWKMMLNANQANVGTSNTLPRFNSIITANQPEWLQNSSVKLLHVTGLSGGQLGVSTIGDGVNALNTTIAILAPNGLVPLQHIKYRANLFTVYSFGSADELGPIGKWLKNVSVGGGLNYTGKPVVGYNTTDSRLPVFYGGENIIYNGMLSKNFKLRRTTVKMQVNINNVFNNTDLRVMYKDQTGSYRYNLQPPRSWSFTTSLQF